MRRLVSFLVCSSVLTASARSQEVIFPDNQPASKLGGLQIIRQGGQTTVSLGGVLFPRKVKVTIETPEGPVVTRFTIPSFLHLPSTPVFPPPAPATILVSIPDTYGLLYVEGEMLHTKGTARQLQSPPLPAGTSYPLRLRCAFQSGDRLLIEDKMVLIQAGDTAAVTFDGTQALSVPLPRDVSITDPAPRQQLPNVQQAKRDVAYFGVTVCGPR